MVCFISSEPSPVPTAVLGSKSKSATPPLYHTSLPGEYIGWLGVGWRQRCTTRLSLRELDSQGTFFFVAVTTAGGRVSFFSLRGES